MKNMLVLILVILAMAGGFTTFLYAEQATASATLVIYIPEKNPPTQIAQTQDDKSSQQTTTEDNIALAKAEK